MAEEIPPPEPRLQALGPISATRSGIDVPLGGPRQRRLLAVLLLHRGEVVSADRVAEAVFAGAPTDAAATTLRSYVARLRRALGSESVLTKPPGYLLSVPQDALDVWRSERDIERARLALHQRDPERAAILAKAALDRWRGDAYAEFAEEEWAHLEAHRLGELRQSAQELLVEAELARGRAAEILPTLEVLRREHPLREGFRTQLMTAYYLLGRRADALKEFRTFRSELSEELGVDPSAALVDLEQRILAQDPELLDATEVVESLRGYRIGDRLGAGQQGSVRAAHLPGVERDLVIRTIPAELADEPDFVRSFASTARRVAALRHPALQPIHDFWREPGAAYVVMPRQPGGSLRDRLSRGPLSRPELVDLVERIGGALGTAAAADLVHGRVRPENVLLDAQGKPVLTDFWLGAGIEPEPADDVCGLVELVRTSSGRPDEFDDCLGQDIDGCVANLLKALGEPVAPRPSRNPYQGLQPFDESDHDVYFGRAGLNAQMTERLERGDRLVLLVGASGTGKSSAVRAGLLPHLRSSAVTKGWFVATMLPGGNPFSELAEALTAIAIAPVDAASLASSDFSAVVDEILPDDEGLLVVVDQFEELFTLTEEPEQHAFLAMLSEQLTAPDGRIRVVATLRADFYDRPLSVQPFGSLVQDATVTIPAMLPAEIEAAIVEPARSAGRTVERGLVAELVSRTASEPAGLPALQFVLHELAERGDLNLAAYEELGGLDGAIATRAEALYQELDDVERRQVRDLFTLLVAVGEDEPTRRRATRAETGTPHEITDRWALARLLTLDVHPETREPTVEVAHEALLREWPRLREWVESSRADLLILERVRRNVRAWQDGGRDPSDLLRGPALEAGLEALRRRAAGRPIESEFLAASEAAEEAERQRKDRTIRVQRLQLIGLVGLLFMALVSGFIAIRQAMGVAAEARNVLARDLASAAMENVSTDPELSVLLALRAVETSHDGDAARPEAISALHSALASNRVVDSMKDPGGNLAEHFGGPSNRTPLGRPPATKVVPLARDREWSPDGRWLATAEDATVRVYRAATEKLGFSSSSHTATVTSVAWSADSALLASGSLDGTVLVYRLTATGLSETQRLTASGLRGGVREVVLASDGTRIFAASADGAVKVFDIREEAGGEIANVAGAGFGASFTPSGESVWLVNATGQAARHDITSGEQFVPSPSVQEVEQVLASSDGAQVLVVGRSRAMVWDTAASESAFLLDTPESAAWSRDGKHLAVLEAGSTKQSARVQVLDRAGEVVGELLADSLHEIRFADNDRLIVGVNGSELLAWDWRRNTKRPVLRVAAEAWTLDAAADGRIVIAPRFGSTAEVRDANGGRLATLIGHEGAIVDATWSADGKMIATASGDGSVRVWRSDAGTWVTSLAIPGGAAPLSVAFSRDTRRLVAGYTDGVTRVWSLDVDEVVDIARDRVTRQLSSAECSTYLHREDC